MVKVKNFKIFLHHYLRKLLYFDVVGGRHPLFSLFHPLLGHFSWPSRKKSTKMSLWRHNDVLINFECNKNIRCPKTNISIYNNPRSLSFNLQWDKRFHMFWIYYSSGVRILAFLMGFAGRHFAAWDKRCSMIFPCTGV